MGGGVFLLRPVLLISATTSCTEIVHLQRFRLVTDCEPSTWFPPGTFVVLVAHCRSSMAATFISACRIVRTHDEPDRIKKCHISYIKRKRRNSEAECSRLWQALQLNEVFLLRPVFIISAAASCTEVVHLRFRLVTDSEPSTWFPPGTFVLLVTHCSSI